MIEWFKSFFSGQPDVHAPAPENPARLAAVALMYEVMHADGDHDESEMKALISKMEQRWQLTEHAARALLAKASERAEQAVDYHQLVQALKHHFSAEQRTELVADMWSIAHADGHIDPHEEYVIRKVADLLYVSHSDFIRGKLHSSKRE